MLGVVAFLHLTQYIVLESLSGSHTVNGVMLNKFDLRMQVWLSLAAYMLPFSSTEQSGQDKGAWLCLDQHWYNEAVELASWTRKIGKPQSSHIVPEPLRFHALCLLQSDSPRAL